jgi:hypothetical protein
MVVAGWPAIVDNMTVAGHAASQSEERRFPKAPGSSFPKGGYCNLDRLQRTSTISPFPLTRMDAQVSVSWQGGFQGVARRSSSSPGLTICRRKNCTCCCEFCTLFPHARCAPSQTRWPFSHCRQQCPRSGSLRKRMSARIRAANRTDGRSEGGAGFHTVA